MLGFSKCFGIWRKETVDGSWVWISAQAQLMSNEVSAPSVFLHFLGTFGSIHQCCFLRQQWPSKGGSSKPCEPAMALTEQETTDTCLFIENLNLPLTTKFRSSLTWNAVQLKHIICFSNMQWTMLRCILTTSTRFNFGHLRSLSDSCPAQASNLWGMGFSDYFR